jgi:hypothetical protein
MWITLLRPEISGKYPVDNPVDKKGSYPHYPQVESYPQIFAKVINRSQKLSTELSTLLSTEIEVKCG